MRRFAFYAVPAVYTGKCSCHACASAFCRSCKPVKYNSVNTLTRSKSSNKPSS